MTSVVTSSEYVALCINIKRILGDCQPWRRYELCWGLSSC